MMTPMKYHPVPGRTRPRHAFGFDHVMAAPDYTRFPGWFMSASLLPVIGRNDVEHLFSTPEYRIAA